VTPPRRPSRFAATLALASVLLAGCGFGGHGGDHRAASANAAAALAADPGGGIAGRLSSSCRARLARAESASRTRVAGLRKLDDRRAALDRSLTPERRALKRLETRSDAAFRQATAHPTATLVAASRASDRAANAAVAAYNARVDLYNATLRRLDALVGREAAAGRGYDTALRRCLIAIRDWPSATRRIEDLLVRPAAAAGTRQPSVACDRPAERTPSRYDETGFVNGHSNVIHLSAPTCFGLERLLTHPDAFACAKLVRRSFENCPVADGAAVVALITLVHEQQHVDGVVDEAVAQCDALQKTALAGVAAGLPVAVARRVAAYTNEAIDQPREYHSRMCRSGGGLDLHLPGAPSTWIFR